MNAKEKLILIELNEVPYRVLDAFCQERPDSTLAWLLSRSRQYATVTQDQWLDPWTSWPTLHRGVPDEQHHILHLGQVLSESDVRYPPIWRLLKAQGKRVGVFGSLHSSALPADVHEYCFYLPDYFDADVFAHPPALRPFQELNLSMTRQSARNVSRRIPLVSTARFMVQAPRLGLRLSTLADCASHLVREVADKSLRIRRRAYQPLVTMDLFVRQLERTHPDFSTFYTNHVAAAMHRYWAAAFPHDYAEQAEATWIDRYHAEISFAMDKFDAMLKHLLGFLEAHPEYTLLVASSMGQAAIPVTRTYGFLTITDIAKFMAALGVPREGWEQRPAMVPCWCVVVKDPFRDRVATEAATLSIAGMTIKRDARPLYPFSYDERERGFFQFFVAFDNFAGSDSALLSQRRLPLADLGLGMMAHEDGVNCTAQHVREGSLWVYHPGLTAQPQRQLISTVDVAPSLLHFYGFERPDYMRGQASIRLR